MNRKAALMWAVAAVAWSSGSASLAQDRVTGDPPNIVSTTPAVGAKDVDPATGEIVVTFDRDMAKGFSWTGGGTNYPPIAEGQRPVWRDARTAVLPVKLAAGRYYRVGINSKSHRNFRSEAGAPARPSAIYFTTRGAGAELTAKAQVPVALEMCPANGATDVDPKTAELRVTFSVPMGGGCSWTGGGPGYPALREGMRPRWTDDQRTCVLPVRLETGRQYRLGLNSPSHKNFQSASGVPLDPVAYTFKTVGYTNQTALLSTSLKTGLSTGTLGLPMKKFPDVSGVVIDGVTDTSLPKLEAVVRCLMEQQKAAKAGDMTRYHEIERQGTSNLLNVVAPTRPIPHATVSLFSREPGSHGGGPWTATADAEGKFEFFDVPQGLYRVVAQDTRKGTNACPSGALTIEHYRSHAYVRPVVYPQTVTVRGRVTDSQGRPVTNATVSAKQGHEGFVPTEGDFTRAYHEATALTDGEGWYELRELVPAGLWEARGLEGGGYGGAYAWYTVTVSGSGYANAKAYVPVVSEETRRAARTLMGLLKSQASPYDKAGRREAAPVAQPPCQGHVLSGVDFAIYRATRIEGIFVNKGGDPQPGCTVQLSLTNSAEGVSYQAFTEASLWAKCDADGRFRFAGVAPGAYKVLGYEENRLVNRKTPLVVTVREGEPLSGLRVVPDALPCGKIEGVVTDATSGKPVKGVTIYSVNKQTGSTECIPFLCLCGKGGYHTAECARWIERVIQTNDLRGSTFSAGKVAPGQTELVVKAPDYAEEHVWVDVVPDRVTNQKIKLWRSGTARIRPVIKDGARVDQYATVAGQPPLVHYVAVPEAGGPGVRGGKPAKQTGYDEFAGLKPGRYTLRGEISYLPGSVSRYETVPVEIASAQTTEVALALDGTCEIKLELAFPPGTAISVRLETADTSSGLEDERNPGLRARAYFREPGSYLLPDLKPGRYRLSLFRMNVPADKGPKKKEEPVQVSVLTLAEGSATQTLNYRLDQAGK
jgi:RNA polymerase sigma-70 factor (ECF subfamily)